MGLLMEIANGLDSVQEKSVIQQLWLKSL
jgi:hypothetical protein